MIENGWPALPYEEWRATRDTLHMYTQVLGKLRLALSPFEPEWGNVPLYLTARGLTTSPMPVGLRAVDADLDLIEHVLVLRSSDGRVERLPLGGAVADLYSDVVGALTRLQVDVTISVLPSEVADPIPFPDDREHATYDTRQVERFFHVLSMIDLIFKEHRAAFRGRSTPVQFFWGTFDLALMRYSGRAVTPPPGAGVIARFGGDAEAICTGWWPGDERVPYPAFYAYGFPKPTGLHEARIAPPGAEWNRAAGEFLLPYETARSASDPEQDILDFARSSYAAAASLMSWDPELTAVAVPPAPGGAGVAAARR
ncbi:MAG TPA: DUF5996 family protein [Candidatus Dormibacteraeota bacterium]|nr:DUF5996 family protein [Candidatus Dormibacteraeota bacterium]